MSLNPNLPEILLALAEGSMQVLLKSDETNELLVLELVKEGTKSWIKAHPIKTTLLAARAVTFFAPPSLLGTLLKVGFEVGVPLFGDSTSTSWMRSLIGDVAGRTILASLRESAMGGLGVGGFDTAALAAGSGFVTGLWSQQKTVKKVREPRSKSSVPKKAVAKKKETVASVSKKTAAKSTKEKGAARVTKSVAAKVTKKKDTVRPIRKKFVAKRKEESMPGAWETEAGVKTAKSRRKAGKP